FLQKRVTNEWHTGYILEKFWAARRGAPADVAQASCSVGPVSVSPAGYDLRTPGILPGFPTDKMAVLQLTRPSPGAFALAGVRFYDRHVRRVDDATGVDVGAEVSAAYSLANLAFCLRDVGGVDNAVVVYVADEDVHAHWCVRQNLRELVGHAAQSDRERLYAVNIDQVNRHGVTGKDRRSKDAPDAAGHVGVAAYHVVGERKNLRVVAV